MQTSHDSETLNQPARTEAFPASVPESMSSHESICENDWVAFRNLEYMENHWTRSPRSASQEDFFWYLTFNDPQLTKAAEYFQNQLNTEGLDLVPLDGLHITVLKIGRSDQVALDELHTAADIAKQKLERVSPFQLTVGPLAGSRGAVRFSVSPWANLFDLHQIARAATLEGIPRLELANTESFRPHLGIGYSNRHQLAEPIIEKVCELRKIAPVSVNIDTLKIVRLRRESHTYRWLDIASVELGASDD